MLLSTLYPVPATVPKLASTNTFTSTNTFARVITGGRTSNATYDFMANTASITGIDLGSNGLTSIGDLLVGKTSAIIGVGPSSTVRSGGLANYSNTGGDIGLFSETTAGQVRLRPDGRLSTTGQFIVSTTGMTYGGNEVWHAGNFTPSNYLTTATASTTYVARSGTNTLPTGDWRINMDSAEGADTGVIRLYPGSAFSAARNAILELNGANATTNPGAFRLLSQGASTISAGTLSLSAPVTVTGGLTVSGGVASIASGLDVTSGGLTVTGNASVTGSLSAGSLTLTDNAFINKAAATLTIGSNGSGGITGALTSYNTNGTQLGLYLNQPGTIYLRPSGRLDSTGQVVITSTAMSWGGHNIWNAGNFNPATKANTASPSFTGTATFSGDINVASVVYLTASSECRIHFNWDSYYLFNNTQNMGFYSAAGYLLQMRKSDKYVLATEFAISSDMRIKEHLEFLDPEAQLANIMLVKPRKFLKNGVVEYGTYAQELKQIWPEMVTTDEAFGFSDFHTIAPNMIHATHIAATQALCVRQEADRDEFRSRIAELEKRVSQQDALIAQLVK